MIYTVIVLKLNGCDGLAGKAVEPFGSTFWSSPRRTVPVGDPLVPRSLIRRWRPFASARRSFAGPAKRL